MQLARWYPTNTTLPSGKVLTTAGSRFFKALAFGGSTDPSSPAASIDDVTPGQLHFPITWESSLAKAQANTPNWPSAREGHTAVWMNILRRMIVFGGRKVNGTVVNDTWEFEYGQPDAELYSYGWTQFTPGPSEPPAPDPRYGHTAVSDEMGTFMIVYGGKDQNGAVSNQVHRLIKNGALWQWDALTQVGELPGGRWGHASAWDNQNGRTIVYGGRSQSGFADNFIYDVKVSGNTATWRRLGTTGTGPSFAREGHTLVWDTEEFTRNGSSGWQRLILFGGMDSGGTRKDDAWVLWFKNDDIGETTMEWQAVAGGTPPPARTRHAAFWDLSRLAMVVIGGDTGSSSSDNDVWQLRTPSYGNPALVWEQLPDHGPGLAGQTVLRAGVDVAAQPELFDPATGLYSNTFDRKLQHNYPQMFVLPSGNLLYPDTGNWTRTLNTTDGHWSVIGGTGDKDFYGDAAAMYLPGKVVKAGQDVGSGTFRVVSRVVLKREVA
jgi:hypothetical protein